MDGLYVFNNPWAIQSMEKHTSYCAMMRARACRSPRRGWCRRRPTSRRPTSSSTLRALRAAVRPRRRSATKLGYPLFMKPYDGGGWAGRHAASTTRRRCARPTSESGTYLHAPADGGRAVRPASCAASASGRRPALVHYDPAAPLHDRYTMDDGVDRRRRRAAPERHDADDQRVLRLGLQLVRGAAQGRRPGTRSTSPTPAPTRRSRRCTTTSRGWCSRTCAGRSSARRPSGRCAQTLDWEPFLRDRRRGRPVRARSCRVRRDRPRAVREADAFEEFCAQHLAHLDEVAWEFFGTDTAKDAVRQKVAALFPPTRSTSSPSCSGSASSSGGPRTCARRAGNAPTAGE